MNKRKVNSFVLALVAAIGFVFPLSAQSQTTMEWLVLSIMRAQAENVWLEIAGTGQEPAIFQTSDAAPVK